MNKKIAIIIASMFLAIAFFLMAMLYFSWDKEQDVTTKNEESSIDSGIDEKFINEEDRIDLKQLMDKTREYVRGYRFIDAMYLINEAKSEYGIEEYSDYEMIRLQEEDVLFLPQLVTQYENGFIDEAIKSVKLMNYPENFFIGYLGFHYDYQMEMTMSSISLLPPPNSKLENVEILKLGPENDVTKRVSGRDMELEAIYEMKMTLNDIDLVAYIAKNNEGYYLYKLTGDTDQMITIEDWMSVKEDTY